MKIKNITHVSLMALMLGVVGSLSSLSLVMAEISDQNKKEHKGDKKEDKGDKKEDKGDKKEHKGNKKEHKGDKKEHKGDKKEDKGDKKEDKGAGKPVTENESTLENKDPRSLKNGDRLFRSPGGRETRVDTQKGNVSTTDLKVVSSLAAHGKTTDFKNANATVHAKKGSPVAGVLEAFAAAHNLPVQGPGGQMSVTGHGEDSLSLLKAVSQVKGNELNSNNSLNTNTEIGSNDTTKVTGFTSADVRGILHENSDALANQNREDLSVLEKIIAELVSSRN